MISILVDYSSNTNPQGYFYRIKEKNGYVWKAFIKNYLENY